MNDYNNSAEVTKVWQQYRHGVEYQDRLGISRGIPTFVDFYEGRQWPPATERTKGLPRPVINITKMICRNKKSAILSTPIKLIYRAAEGLGRDVDAIKFNRFADHIQRELGQEELDKWAIHCATIKGSYIYHYFWDAEARGKTGVRAGALRGEIIDPLAIFFADPTEIDEQKQEWIIIASRENVKGVRAKADKDIDQSLIIGDENEDKYGTKEQEGDRLCTVLTRYFRKDGEVWFEKSVKSTIVNKPRPLSPDVEAAMRELSKDEITPDPANNSLPDSEVGEELIPRKARAVLYPIVVGSYEPREKSIYGLGEVEGIIPNQKLINFLMGMSALSVQEQAWGKYVVLPGALGNQKITNEPGQVLEDKTGRGDGIKRMTEQAIHSMPLELIDKISSLTRVVTGASEVMTGETLGASMSGAAIAQLQAQAQQPIEELKDAYHIVATKRGKVLAQFFKLYYADEPFTYEEDAEGGETVIREDLFDSADFSAVDFEVTVEATAGTKASAAADINMLESLLKGGHIDVKTFIKAYPDAISNRTEILKGLELAENSKVKMYEAQIAELQGMLQQYAAAYEEAEKKAYEALPLINENKRLKETLISLYNEAKEKIDVANSQIEAGNAGYIQKSAEADEARADASEFAQHIAQTEFAPRS